MFENLKKADPEIYESMKRELKRQQRNIELIASEPGGLQALDDLLHVALVQHADVNLRVAEIRGGVHRRDIHI